MRDTSVYREHKCWQYNTGYGEVEAATRQGRLAKTSPRSLAPEPHARHLRPRTGGRRILGKCVEQQSAAQIKHNTTSTEHPLQHTKRLKMHFIRMSMLGCCAYPTAKSRMTGYEGLFALRMKGIAHRGVMAMRSNFILWGVLGQETQTHGVGWGVGCCLKHRPVSMKAMGTLAWRDPTVTPVLHPRYSMGRVANVIASPIGFGVVIW